MSKEIDEKIVRMKFDNAQFERGIKTSLRSLENLGSGIKASLGKISGLASALHFDSLTRNFSLAGIENSINSVSDRFSAMGVVGMTVLQNLTNSAVEAGKKIVSALAIDPLKMGFQEYETQINAVQTILANTESKGTTIDDVNKALDELNHYADMTIYNFTEMTRNIGTFTAAGVDLDTSVSAIKGIANLAAVSGSNSQQASTAMYQLSQALAAGSLKLQDWNSVVNAGMGGQVFQDALKETARVHGIAIDDMIKQQGSFRETLSSGWITSEILTETLAKFTGDLTEEELKAIGYNEEQIKSILKMGETANDAATKVKTFTQLFDTLKEALQSGWTQSWEILVGDFVEAKELLTSISDVLSELINASSDSRNAMLQGWKDLGGRNSLIEAVRISLDSVISIGKSVKKMFSAIIPPITSKNLYDITLKIKDLSKGFKEFADKIKAFSDGFGKSADVINKAKDGLSGFTDKLVKTDKSVSIVDELKKTIEAIMFAFKGGVTKVGEFVSRFTELGGIGSIIETLKNALAGVFKIVRLAAEAFTGVFLSSGNGADFVFGLVEKIRMLTESIAKSDSVAVKIKNTFSGIFKVIKVMISAVGSLVSIIINNAGSIASVVVSVITSAASVLSSLIPAVISLAGQVIPNLISVFQTLVPIIANVIQNAISLGGQILPVLISAFSKIVRTVSSVVNEFIRLGGVSSVVGVIKNAFDSVCKIIGILKDAFSEVFSLSGSGTKTVYDLIEGVRKLTASFLGSESTADSLKRIFKGVFAGFDIGIRAVKGISNAFSGLTGGSGASIGKMFLSAAAGIGDFLVKLDNAVVSSDFFNSGLEKAVGVIRTFVSAVTAIGGKIKSAFTVVKEVCSNVIDGISEKLSARAEESSKALNVIKSFLSGVSDGFKKSAAVFEKIGETFKNIFSALTPIFTKLGEFAVIAFDSIMDAVFRALDEVSFDEILDLFNTGLFAALVVAVKGFFDNLSSIGSSANGVLGSLKDVLDGVKGSLETWQNSLKADILFKIAGSVAVLAASLIALSLVDSEKLAVALGGVTVMLGELMGSLAAFSKIAGMEGFAAVTKMSGILFGLSVSVFILSTAVMKLSVLDWNGLVKGLSGVGILLAGLGVFLNKVKIDSLGLSKGIGLMALAGGIYILAGAASKIASIDIAGLVKGLAGIGVILAELGIFLNSTTDVKKVLSTSVGITILGAAMLIFASAVKKLGELPIEIIGKGLLALSASLVAVGVFLNNTTGVSKVISTSVGLVILGKAILIFSEAIGQLGSMSLGQLGKGLLAMAVSLTEVAVALKFLPSNTILIGAGLVAVASAIRIISSAVQTMGGMSWEELGKGLLAMSVSLAAIVVALNASSGAAMGAVGILAAAAAISVFTPALLMLGTMSLAEIGSSLLALAGTFTVIGLAGVVLAPLTPVILGLSAALLLLGAGSALLGIGVAALAAGLSALAVSGVAAIVGIFDALNEAVPIICKSIATSAPVIVKALGEVILLLIAELTLCSSQIFELVRVVLTEVIDLLDEFTPKIIDLVGDILMKLIGRISQDIPVIADLGLQMLTGLLRAIADNIQNVVEAGVDIVPNFIKGIQSKLGDIIQTGIDFILEFINGIADGIRNNAEPFMEAMANLVDAIINGFITGIKGCREMVVDAVKDIGDAAVGGLKDLLGIHSPSKVFSEIGGYVSEGFAKGITGSSSKAENAADGMGNSVINSMSGTMRSIADIVSEDMNMSPTISPVVDLTNVQKGVSRVTDLVSSASGKTGTLSLSAETSYNESQKVLNSTKSSSQNNQNVIGAISRLESKVCGQMVKISVVNKVDKLIQQVDKLSEEMTNMKVVMDSGALVGQISSGLDSSLGFNTATRKRGV